MERDTHKPPLSSPFMPRPKCVRCGQGICGGEGGGEAALVVRGVEESQVWGRVRVNGWGLCSGSPAWPPPSPHGTQSGIQK